MRLELQLKLKQVLAPQLIQSLKMLQMPLLRLEQTLRHELSTNPLLEEEEIPEWLTGIGEELTEEMPEAVAEEESPAWLAGLGFEAAGEMEQAPQPPDELGVKLPDAEEAPAIAGEEEVPEWLTELSVEGSVAAANYYAVIDPDTCTGCGICIDRCQVGAIADDGGVSVVDRALCIGCGLCVTGCPDDAAHLHLKPEEEIIHPPADFEAWEDARLADRGLAE